MPSPWFVFAQEGYSRPRWCQPDGLLLDLYAGRIVIVEIKYQHTPDAWWQVRQLYQPVVRSAFGPDWDIRACEVVKWYDPAIGFPEPVALAKDPALVRDTFGVHIWKP